MKIKDETWPLETFEDFMTRNGLTVVLKETSSDNDYRYLAGVQGYASEVFGPLYGKGDTKVEAVVELSRLLLRKLMVPTDDLHDPNVQFPNEWKDADAEIVLD